MRRESLSTILAATLMLALAGPVSGETRAPQNGTNGTSGEGGEGGTLTVKAARAPSPPELDGRLDDAAWAVASVATDFTQRRPDPGAPASFRTEVRVLYDDEAVYVGMRLRDPSPSEIAAQLGRRDPAHLS